MACCKPVLVVCPKGGIDMYQGQENGELNILRARFTIWLEKLIKNAKIDYLRKLKKLRKQCQLKSCLRVKNLLAIKIL